MIKLESWDVYGWEAAIRGMRNPLNSWELSDSDWCMNPVGFEDCHNSPLGKCPRHGEFREDLYCVGKRDLELMQKLVKAGSDHRKFMRMISVWVDVTAPLYWWKEFDTYKVGTVANSCSTMHTIADKKFEITDFSFEHCENDAIMVGAMNHVITILNMARDLFIKTKDKAFWWDMIQLLPSSYNQRRTVQLNYEVLRNIYFARKAHKLDEWRDFCEWVERLPYGKELISIE